MIYETELGTRTLDIGDKCTHCGRDTSHGSGLWVNRIPSFAESSQAQEWLHDWEKVDCVDGYLCRECLEDDGEIFG